MMLKKRFLLLCICTFATALGVGAAEHVTEIEVLKGEKWWGLDYGGRLEQPLSGYIEQPKSVRLSVQYTSVMVSNAGRYIYSDNPIKVNFDDEKLTIISEHEKVEVQSGGKSLREAYVVCALKNFTPGQSPDPQMFALPIYETYYDFGYTHCEDVIIGYAEKLIAEGFPAGIIVIENGWQKVNGPYEFDPELYPDPKRMVDKLHGLGFKVMLAVSPDVPRWGSVYGMAWDNNQIINKYSSSQVATLDMGNDIQFARLRSGFDKIKANYGFDGFRFEWDYDVPTDSVKFMANMMSLSEGLGMVQYLEVMNRAYAPYASAIWNWNVINNELLPVVTVAVTSGLMGYSYASINNGYIIKEPKMADYLLLQCGMPVMSVDFAPWRITDPKLYKGVKDAINFRASLADYMVKLVEDSRRTGEPLVRHMEYQYPKSAFFDCNDQFMLGTKYLFAPCVDGGDKRMVRLPKGTWVDRNGTKIRGPVVKEVDCSGGELIYFEAAR